MTMRFFEKYLARKSKLGLIFNAAVVILAIFIMIPQTRKATTALMLRATIFIYQPSLLAKPIPLQADVEQWQLRTLDGDTCQFADFLGKPLIINYWASWCAPCIAEMGQFEKLYADYADDVNFLFISNEKKSDILKFQKRKKIQMPIYQAINNYPQQLSANTLPVTFIISPDRNILMRKSGIVQWNGKRMRNIIRQLIDKN